MKFDACARRLALAAAVIVCFTAASTVRAADLTVTVRGLSSNDGHVHMALYDNPDAFPKRTGMLLTIETPVAEREGRWIFKDLAPGRYAIAVYHDADDDDEFDQGIFGIPLEDYGFSNDALVFLGPPSFEEAAFDIGPNDANIVIRVD